MQVAPAVVLPFGTQPQPLPGCSVHARLLFQLVWRPFRLSRLELPGLITWGGADLAFQGVSVTPCLVHGDSCEA